MIVTGAASPNQALHPIGGWLGGMPPARGWLLLVNRRLSLGGRVH